MSLSNDLNNTNLQKRVAGAQERLQRQSVTNKLRKAFRDRDGVWPTVEDQSSEEPDPLIKLCFQDPKSRIGFVFEAIKAPTFSSLLKRVGFRKKIVEFESGLERACEIYGATRSLVGLIFEISGIYYIYSGNPVFEESDVDFMRMTLPSGERRYICSLDGAIDRIFNLI